MPTVFYPHENGNSFSLQLPIFHAKIECIFLYRKKCALPILKTLYTHTIDDIFLICLGIWLNKQANNVFTSYWKFLWRIGADFRYVFTETDSITNSMWTREEAEKKSSHRIRYIHLKWNSRYNNINIYDCSTNCFLKRRLRCSQLES